MNLLTSFRPMLASFYFCKNGTYKYNGFLIIIHSLVLCIYEFLVFRFALNQYFDGSLEVAKFFGNTTGFSNEIRKITLLITYSVLILTSIRKSEKHAKFLQNFQKLDNELQSTLNYQFQNNNICNKFFILSLFLSTSYTVIEMSLAPEPLFSYIILYIVTNIQNVTIILLTCHICTIVWIINKRHKLIEQKLQKIHGRNNLSSKKIDEIFNFHSKLLKIKVQFESMFGDIFLLIIFYYFVNIISSIYIFYKLIDKLLILYFSIVTRLKIIYVSIVSNVINVLLLVTSLSRLGSQVSIQNICVFFRDCLGNIS